MVQASMISQQGMIAITPATFSGGVGRRMPS
jgi:hypothetical protein